MRISDWSSDVCSSDLHHLPRRAQHGLARAVGKVDAGAFEPRRRHLARERALPDQLIEPRMIAAARLVLRKIGWADRLMRFLCILRLGLILARLVRNIAAVVARRDGLAGRADRAVIHLAAVGSSEENTLELP